MQNTSSVRIENTNTKKPLNVMIIENKEDDVLLIVHELERGGYQVNYKQVDSGESMKIALDEMKWDIILSDFNVPNFNAFASLELLKSTSIDLPFIVVSGTVGEETAVKLMREGAKDFILKNNLKHLIPVIERETREYWNRLAKTAAEIELKEQRNQNENLEKLQEELRISYELLRNQNENLENLQKALITRQEDLIAKEIELTRSNQSLNQFANMTSHDLREPLRMVKQYIRLLAKRYKDKLDSDANEFIGYAVDGVDRMENMIKSILDYAKLNKEAVPVEFTSTESALEKAKMNLTAAIEESRAEITNDKLPLLKINSVQLTQIFQNLISNAIKYSYSDTPAKIHIGVQKKVNGWYFLVRDNGIGVKPEYFERIFLPFQRLHTNREYEGIGLGLSFCKKIVEQHGGNMWVESETGKGSSFFFTIPD